MFDAIKPLVDNGIINEETRNQINEAWESKFPHFLYCECTHYSPN